MGRLNFYKIIPGGLRQILLALGRLLRTVPTGWLILMGILAVPIAILSALIAIVFFLLLALLAIIGLIFYLFVWRPVFGPVRRREKVIEAEYTVLPEDDQ